MGRARYRLLQVCQSSSEFFHVQEDGVESMMTVLIFGWQDILCLHGAEAKPLAYAGRDKGQANLELLGLYEYMQ